MFTLCCSLMLAMPSPDAAVPLRQNAAPQTPAVGLKLTYAGSLEPVGSGAGTESLRSFRTTFVVAEVTASDEVRVVWVMEESGGKPRWPWSQRFGAVPLSKSLRVTNDRELPAIQGELDGMVRVVPLALAFYGSSAKLRAGAEWDEGDRHVEVVTHEEVGGRPCWVVTTATKFGGRSVDWVDEHQAVLVRHREVVFLGQGVRHELRIDLDHVETLAPDALATYTKAHAALATLRGKVKDKLSEPVNAPPPATAAFLEQARSMLGGLREDRLAGPYSALAADVMRQTQSALDAQKAVDKLRAQLVGKAAPHFALTTTRGDQVSLADLKGVPIVLHFWDYHAEPKVAPYGETGYLDFLWRQREKQGVRIIGIAVDDRLRPRDDGSEDGARTARKDIRAFCDFMNLSYPIALDTAKVIDQYGDPRRIGGKLPLYVVIAPDGTVSAYHPGLWSTGADEGLKELDQRLQALKR